MQDHLRFGAPPKLRPRTAGSSRNSLPPHVHDLATSTTSTSRPDGLAFAINALKEAPSLLLRQRLQSPRPGSAAPQQTPQAPRTASSSDEKGVFMKPPMRPKSATAASRQVSRHRMQLVQEAATLLSNNQLEEDSEFIRDPESVSISHKEDMVRPGVVSTAERPSNYRKRPFSAASTPSSCPKRANMLTTSNQSAEISSNFALGKALSGSNRPHSAAASTRYQPFRTRDKSSASLASCLSVGSRTTNTTRSKATLHSRPVSSRGDRLLASTRNHSDNTFVYAVPRHFLEHGLPHDPYDIVPVTHEALFGGGSISQMQDARWDYYTISQSGYTFHLKSDDFQSTFLSLRDWEAQKANFTKLRNLSTFSRFRYHKVFVAWGQWVKHKKHEAAQENLLMDSYFSYPVLLNGMNDIRKELSSLSELQLMWDFNGESSSLESFTTANVEFLKTRTKELRLLVTRLQTILNGICRLFLGDTAPLHAGFPGHEFALSVRKSSNYHILESYVRCEQGLASAHQQFLQHKHFRSARLSASEAAQARNALTLSSVPERGHAKRVEKPSRRSNELQDIRWTMASIKRRKCKQLTKFVTLVDFLVLDAYSGLVQRSLDLFHAFILRGANAATIIRLEDHDDLALAMHQTVRQSASLSTGTASVEPSQPKPPAPLTRQQIKAILHAAWKGKIGVKFTEETAVSTLSVATMENQLETLVFDGLSRKNCANADTFSVDEMFFVVKNALTQLLVLPSLTASKNSIFTSENDVSTATYCEMTSNNLSLVEQDVLSIPCLGPKPLFSFDVGTSATSEKRGRHRYQVCFKPELTVLVRTLQDLITGFTEAFREVPPLLSSPEVRSVLSFADDIRALNLHSTFRSSASSRSVISRDDGSSINDDEERSRCPADRLSERMEKNTHILSMRDDIQELVRSALLGAEELAAAYSPLLELRQQNESINLDLKARLFRRNEYTLDEMKDEANNFTNQLSALETLRMSSNVAFLHFSMQQLQAELLPSPARCLYGMRDLLPRLARERCDQFLLYISVSSSKIEKPKTQDLDAFTTYLLNLREVYEEIYNKEQDLKFLHEFFALLETLKFPASVETVKAFVLCDPEFHALKSHVLEACTNRDNDLQSYTPLLTENLAKLTRSTNTLQSTASDHALTAQSSSCQDAQDNALQLHQEAEQMLHEARRLVRVQHVFAEASTGLRPPSQKFEDLHDLAAELKLKSELWEAVCEADGHLSACSGDTIRSVDLDKMNDVASHVDLVVENIRQCATQVASSFELERLEKLQATLHGLVPVIRDLRNPHLVERHWSKLEHKLQCSLLPSIVETPECIEDEEVETSTCTGSRLGLQMQQLLDVNVVAHASAIRHVSEEASAEAAIAGSFQSLVRTWKSQNIPIEARKDRDGRDAYCIGDCSELTSLIEESQVLLRVMELSTYSLVVEERLPKMMSQLNHTNESLELLLICQRKWDYTQRLVSIDFARTFPDQAKQLQKHDTLWRALTLGLFNRPQCLPFGGSTEHRQSLVQVLEGFEAAAKILAEHLEIKRQVFPVLFQLSDLELATLLSKCRDVGCIQAFLYQCFENVGRIVFGTRDGFQDILQITSRVYGEAETIAMGKNLKARGPVEQWLAAVEKRLAEQLRRSTKQAVEILSRYSVKDDETPKLDTSRFSVQSILLADRIVRCAIIENGTKDITKLSDERTTNEIAAYSAQVNSILLPHNQTLSPREITLRTCLRLQELQFRDAFSSHMATKQSSSCSVPSGGLAVEWQYQLKYRMDDATTVGHECHVEMNTLKIPYGFNYSSPHSDVVVTPSCLRSLFALFACVRHAQACALTGPSESGKKTLSVQVSSIIGRRHFGATLTSYTHATRLLIGALYAGGTFCAKLQLNLKIQDNAPLIKTLATTLAAIEHAVLTKNSIVGVHRSPITLSPGTAMFVVFPSSVRMRDAEEIRVWTESLSHFAIVQWDQSCIVEALLMSRGFTDPRHLAKQLLILREHARSTLDVSIRSLSVYESLFSFSALKAVINDAASQLALRNIDHKRLIGEAVLRYFSVRVGETQLKDLEAIVKSIFASDNETGLQARISIRPDLQESIRVAARALHFIPRQAMIDSVSSLATALTSSVSTVLVGPSGVGKTTSYQVLAKAFELSLQRSSEDESFSSNDDTLTLTGTLTTPVKNSKSPRISIHVVLPMALTVSQLYGGVSLDDHGRMPSILGQFIREAQDVYTGNRDSKPDTLLQCPQQVWVVFDDALDLRWLEGLLAVLVSSSDSVSPLLAFEDGEFMTLPPNLRFLYEVFQLRDATPNFLHVTAILHLNGYSLTDTHAATSKCVDDSRMELSTAYFHRYIELQRERIRQSDVSKSQVWSSTDTFNLVEKWLISSSLLEELGAALDTGSGDTINLSPLQRVTNLVSLLQSLVSSASALSDSKVSTYPVYDESIPIAQIRVELALTYSLMWGYAAGTEAGIKRQVSDLLLRHFGHLKPAWISCMPHVNLYETLLDLQGLRFVSVVSSTGSLALPPPVSTSFSSLFIPTSSSLVVHAALREALRSGRGVLLIGGHSSRRTTLARNFLSQFDAIRSILAANGVSNTTQRRENDSGKTRKPALSKATEAATLASVKRLRLRQISLVTLMAMRLQKENNETGESSSTDRSIVEAEEGAPLSIAPSMDPVKTAMIRQFDRGDVTPFFFAIPHGNVEAVSELANCVERMLQRERTDVFEPPPGKTALLILDDLHLATPTEECSLKQVYPSAYAYLRSVQEHRRVYRGSNCAPISVEHLMLLASIHRDGFQKFTTQGEESARKLTTQFFPVLAPSCELEELHNIFDQALQSHWSASKTSGTLSPAIRYAIPMIVAATTVLWDRLRRAYKFCLQDLARVYEGLAVATPSVLSDVETLLRLWTHEICRALREPSMGLCASNQDAKVAAEIVRMRSIVSQVTQRRASVRASLALGSASGLSFAKRQSVQVSPENDENASPATILALFSARMSAPSGKRLSRPSLQFNSLQEQQHRAVMMGGLWAFVPASIYYGAPPLSLEQLEENSISSSADKSASTRALRRSSASFMRRKSMESAVDSSSSTVVGRSGKWMYAELSFEDDAQAVSTATVQAYLRDLRTFSSTLRPNKTAALARDVPGVPFKLALAVVRIDRVLARPAARLVLLDNHISGAETLLRYATASRAPEGQEDSAIFTLSGLPDDPNITSKCCLMTRWKRLVLDLYDRIGVFGQEATLVIKRLDLLPTAIVNQIQALMTTGEVPGILSLEEQVNLATRVCDERLLALKAQHAALVAQIRAQAEAARDQALAILHQKQRDAPTTPMLDAFQQVETRYQRELRSNLARVDLRYQQDSDDLRRQREVESESVAATVMALTRPLGVTSGKWASAVARMCAKLRVVLLVDKEHAKSVRTTNPSIFSTCDVVSMPQLDRDSLRTIVYGHFHAQISSQMSDSEDSSQQLLRSLWSVACMATEMHLAVVDTVKNCESPPLSRIFAMATFFGKLFIENVKREEAFRAKTAWFLDLSNRLDRDLCALRSSDKLLTEQLSTIDQQLINDEVKLTEQKQDAERVRLIMERFRAAADEQILITNEAQEQAQKELKEPMSCLEEANRALLLVDRRHIIEIKSFVSPPPLVHLVLGAICVLFQLESSWESARRLLLGDANFVQNLLQFNKDAVSAATLTKLESEFLSDERFRREEVERQSVAAASMVGWVRAIHQYATSRHKVQPTLDKLDKAQGRLQLIMREFQVSRDRAGDADAAWQATQAAIDTASTRKDALRSEMTSLSARCDSGQLAVEALTEDRELQREAANAISMRRGFSLTTWNALLSAGALTYACELSALSVREQVFQAWGAAYCCYGGLTPGCPPTSTCCTFVPSISVVLKEGDALTETPLSGLFNGEYLPDGGCIDETTKLVTSVGDLIFSRRRLWDASLLSLVALTSSLPAVMITRFSSEMEQLLVSCARRVWHWPQLHMVHARARDFDDVFKVAARSGHQLVVLDVEPHDAQPLNEENECLAAALDWSVKCIDGTEHLVIARRGVEAEDSDAMDTIALHPNFRLILTSHACRDSFGEILHKMPTLDGYLHSDDMVDVMLDKISSESGKFTLKTALEDHAQLAQQYEAAQNQLTKLLEAAAVTTQFPLSQTKALRERVTALQQARQILRDKRRDIQEQLRLVKLQCTPIARTGAAVFNAFNAVLNGYTSPPLTLQVFEPILLAAVSTIPSTTDTTGTTSVPTSPDTKRSAASRRFGILARTAASFALSSRPQSSSSGIPSEVLTTLLSRVAPLIPTGDWYRFLLQVIISLEENQSTSELKKRVNRVKINSTFSRSVDTILLQAKLKRGINDSDSSVITAENCKAVALASPRTDFQRRIVSTILNGCKLADVDAIVRLAIPKEATRLERLRVSLVLFPEVTEHVCDRMLAGYGVPLNFHQRGSDETEGEGFWLRTLRNASEKTTVIVRTRHEFSSFNFARRVFFHGFNGSTSLQLRVLQTLVDRKFRTAKDKAGDNSVHLAELYTFPFSVESAEDDETQQLLLMLNNFKQLLEMEKNEIQTLEEAPLAVINMTNSAGTPQNWEILTQILHRSSPQTSSTTFQRHNSVEIAPKQVAKRLSTVATEGTVKNSNRSGHRASTSQSMTRRVSAIDLVTPTYPRLVAAVEDWRLLPIHLRSNIICLRDEYEEEFSAVPSLSKCLQSTILRLSMYPSVQTLRSLAESEDDLVKIPVPHLWQVLTCLVLFHATLVVRNNVLRSTYSGVGDIFHYGDDDLLTALNQYLATIREKKQNTSTQRRHTEMSADSDTVLERKMFQQVALSSYTRLTAGYQEVEFLKRLFSDCLQLVSWDSSSEKLGSLPSVRGRSRQMSVCERLRSPGELVASTHTPSMPLIKGISTLSVVNSSLRLGFLGFPSESLRTENLSMNQWLELVWNYSASVDQYVDSKLQRLLLGYQHLGVDRRGSLNDTSRDLFATSRLDSSSNEMRNHLEPEWTRTFGWFDESRDAVSGDPDMISKVLLRDASEIIRAIVADALPPRIDPESCGAREENDARGSIAVQTATSVMSVYNRQVEGCLHTLETILASLLHIEVPVIIPEEQEGSLPEHSGDEEDDEDDEEQDEISLLRIEDVKDTHVRMQVVSILRNEVPANMFDPVTPPPISSSWSLHDVVQHYQDWHDFISSTKLNVTPSRWWLPAILAAGLSLTYILNVTQKDGSSKIDFMLRLPPGKSDEDGTKPPERPVPESTSTELCCWELDGTHLSRA
ncbi:Microtubule-binding stalk of dynein motor domain-containing protein [Phytophthora infestans]|uniref:Microtubule-binding stalk of dynein motor domain-containing protein n=1 Tax=Phytophthora infestans TaxID=4787 RepID=A0A8S9U7M6_PHYIN|nr:Microtubule-binding stalk of dynein motor domain-containing protein [Phytophthora infestans]